MTKGKRGRPTIPEEDKKRYKRVAVYPDTHEKVVELASLDNEEIVDWMSKRIDGIYRKKAKRVTE